MFTFKSPCTTWPMPQAARQLAQDQTIYLLDVRTAEEYNEGHIPGSKNLPLDRITQINTRISNKNTRLFVYCHSGARSQQACAYLVKMGYTDVTNIGGIVQWNGKLEY